MAWEDPIVEAVRQIRDAYAKQFNYDLDAIYRDLKAKEKKSGRTVVPCPPKAPQISRSHQSPASEPASRF